WVTPNATPAHSRKEVARSCCRNKVSQSGRCMRGCKISLLRLNCGVNFLGDSSIGRNARRGRLTNAGVLDEGLPPPRPAGPSAAADVQTSPGSRLRSRPVKPKHWSERPEGGLTNAVP